ncbi:MAG: hypothetical protein JXD23_02315 [Spirochaetales bacterium]|nr:hypothetical protein [Spirochaetales bacterium]
MKNACIFLLVFTCLTGTVSAAMIDGSVELYNAPDGKRIGVLYDGTKVALLADRGAWREIKVTVRNHRNIRGALENGTAELYYLYDDLLGRIGHIERGVTLRTAMEGNAVSIAAFIEKTGLKEAVRYYSRGERKLTSPRSVYFSLTEEISELQAAEIAEGAGRIDPVTYDRDVLFIEAGYSGGALTTIICYSLLDGHFEIKERYHCDQSGRPLQYVTGYDPAERHVVSYFGGHSYKDFFWTRSPQTSIFAENGHLAFVLYTPDHEYELRLTLTVAENKRLDPPFHLQATRAAICKIDRIAGQTVQKEEFDSLAGTEEILGQIRNSALFKRQIRVIPSGIDFEKEFGAITAELLDFYK